MTIRGTVAKVATSGAQLLGRVAAGVWPQMCVFCGVECSDAEDGICEACTADLPWLDSACPRCAAPLPARVPCGDCQSEPPVFASALAALRYSFPVDAAIRRLKFHRRLEYAPVLGQALVARAEDRVEDVDALLPVPLNWQRRFARGYNQAFELCRPLAVTTGIPLLTDIRRTRPTPFQSGLPASARKGNVAGAFRARRRINARHVLVVDDVMTTGATCNAVAAAALDAGAERVSVLVLARAQPGLKA